MEPQVKNKLSIGSVSCVFLGPQWPSFTIGLLNLASDVVRIEQSKPVSRLSIWSSSTQACRQLLRSLQVMLANQYYDFHLTIRRTYLIFTYLHIWLQSHSSEPSSNVLQLRPISRSYSQGSELQLSSTAPLVSCRMMPQQNCLDF
jgi:hypothetical protein